ncbi:PAAR domain-containing protein [Paraburkholderia sp. SOS3]|uniref:PAAR domain-containing protein n=1 Tax=Paraburkholderia sp. SOS3 TaxID=1926494 RepID=UPI000947451C|nr:PAAR domain-containing protein [Paraburkholderia sp. SOS3]APR34196.1 hypothetical protein BTO02_00870 [Paraburkholderia sp. SOS3]
MRRFTLRKGDKSSADGVVLEGEERCMEFGRASTYIGAKVHCPACKTVGTIAAKGPRWPDSMFGKEQALEGDICLCKCNPPPVMIASQNRSFHEFSAGQLAAFNTDRVAASEPIAPRDDEHLEQYFEIVDAWTKEPVEGMTYKLLNNGATVIYDAPLVGGKTQAVSVKDSSNLRFVAWHSGSVR